jgi:hypothetical protein
VPMADDAEPPATWRCRKHGVESRRVDGEHEEKPKKPVRTHWDMLLERRTIEDLEELLVEQLSKLSERRHMTHAAKSTTAPSAPKEACS